MKRNTINLFLAIVTILGTQAITSMSLMGMHQPTLMHTQKLNKSFMSLILITKTIYHAIYCLKKNHT